MSLPIPQQPSCAQAWLAATKGVQEIEFHQAYNVLIDIQSPLVVTDRDIRITTNVDTFLKSHDRQPLQTVANTIFPQSTYERYGAPNFYDIYLNTIYPRIKRKQGDWGRYFERMIRVPNENGINPLDNLVNKMKSHAHQRARTFRHVYELAVFDPELDIRIYDPVRDAGPVMNRQCLSFLSFKLDSQNRVLLTAIYRNHYYVERLLGNLIGLSRLLAFVGKEAGLQVGSLTVLSTHAHVDTGSWSLADVSILLNRCQAE